MRPLPFSVRFELEGWELFWARLEKGGVVGEELAVLREETASAVRERFPAASDIAVHPAVAALRRLFKQAGCDPTRYRPSSEALLRRLVKGNPLPAIQPLVDVSNCLSAQLAVPCCVMVEGSFGGPLVFRSGRPGESYESLRGPFSLQGKPLLVDERGPLDTPITGNQRVKVVPETERAWLVAYLPEGVVTPSQAWAALSRLQDRSGVVAALFASTTVRS